MINILSALSNGQVTCRRRVVVASLLLLIVTTLGIYLGAPDPHYEYLGDHASRAHRRDRICTVYTAAVLRFFVMHRAFFFATTSQRTPYMRMSQCSTLLCFSTMVRMPPPIRCVKARLRVRPFSGQFFLTFLVDRFRVNNLILRYTKTDAFYPK